MHVIYTLAHYIALHTSTRALYLLSSFEVMYKASEWKGELSPTKISVRHCSPFSPLVRSGLLKIGKSELKHINMPMYREDRMQTILTLMKQFYNRNYRLIAWRNRNTLVLFLSSNNWKQSIKSIQNPKQCEASAPNLREERKEIRYQLQPTGQCREKK